MTSLNAATTMAQAPTLHYLSMRMGDGVFALAMHQVLDVLPLSPVTSLPHTPTYIKGVMAHHDEVIPVIDLQAWFQTGEPSITEEAVMIIVKYGLDKPYQRRMGLIVEHVLENDMIATDRVKAAPTLGQQADNKGITGLFSVQDTVVRMIDTNLLSRQALT